MFFFFFFLSFGNKTNLKGTNKNSEWMNRKFRSIYGVCIGLLLWKECKVITTTTKLINIIKLNQGQCFICFGQLF